MKPKVNNYKWAPNPKSNSAAKDCHPAQAYSFSGDGVSVSTTCTVKNIIIYCTWSFTLLP